MKILEINRRFYELQNTTICKDFNIFHYKKWELDPREWTAHGTSIFFISSDIVKDFEKYDGIYSVFECDLQGKPTRKGHHWISGYIKHYSGEYICVVRVPRRYHEDGQKMFLDELKVYGKHKLDYSKL